MILQEEVMKVQEECVNLILSFGAIKEDGNIVWP